MGIIAAAGERPVQLSFGFDSFSELALTTLVQHGHNRANNFQVTQFFRSDIEQHVLSARIVFSYRLSKVPACSRELALRTAELLQEQICQTRIRRRDSDGVLQAFIVYEHS